MNDPAIFLAAKAIDETSLLQPVDQAGNSKNNSNGPAGNLQNGQRLALPSQDAQDVVLRRGQGMFPQQPGAANLKLVARANDAQGRLLFRRLEGPSLLEFVLQLRGRHMAQLVKFVQLQIVYISSICMSSLFRTPDIDEPGNQRGRGTGTV